MDTIYFDQCHHIENHNIQSSKCLKRVFYITQAHEYYPQKLAVCNELIRLKFQTHSLDDELHWIGEGCYLSKTYDGIIDEIISSVFPVKHSIPKSIPYLGRYSNSITNPRFSYIICHRPCLLREITLYDSINLINQYGWNKVNNDFKQTVANNIVETGNRILKSDKKMYIKKGIKDEVAVILNRFKNYYRIGNRFYFTTNGSDEFNINITKLLINFLTIQSTLNLK